MSRPRGMPRKFAEKIALLEKKEAESTAEFEKIIQEVEQTTRATTSVAYPQNHQLYYGEHDGLLQPATPTRSSSFSNWQTYGRQQRCADQGISTNQLHAYRNDSNRAQSALPTRHQALANQQSQSTINDGIDIQQPVSGPSMNNQDARYKNITNFQSGNLEVPNIAIYPTSDDQNCSQRQSTIAVQNSCFPNPNFRNDCSNPISIGQSRSMPNISNLTVSGTPTSSPYDTSDQYMQRAANIMSNNQLESTAVAGSGNFGTVSCQIESDNGAFDCSSNYFDDQNQEYCSLPAVQDAYQAQQQNSDLLNRDQPARRSHTNMTRPDRRDCGAWQGAQQVAYNSAPSSAAPTPPIVSQSMKNESVETSPIHDPHVPSSRNSPQHPSPQTVTQDHQNQQHQQPVFDSTVLSSMPKANSVNFINEAIFQSSFNLLEPPTMSNHLSKSTEAHFSYMDNYSSGDGYSEFQQINHT